MSLIQVHVRFFAGHRDIVRAPSKTYEIAEGMTVSDLWQHIVADYPALQGAGSYVRFAINQQFSDPITVLQDGDEVAYIPPVSGGATDAAAPPPPPAPEVAPLLITEAVLDPLPLMAWAQTPSDGAIVVFAGVVRDNLDGRATASLSYEAYADMALGVLQQLTEDARSRWQTGRIAVHHRVGHLAIGTTVVLVVVAAPHRKAAFAAADWLMDRIKEEVPIWKCEHWADGTSEWHEGQA